MNIIQKSVPTTNETTIISESKYFLSQSRKPRFTQKGLTRFQKFFSSWVPMQAWKAKLEGAFLYSLFEFELSPYLDPYTNRMKNLFLNTIKQTTTNYVGFKVIN